MFFFLTAFTGTCKLGSLINNWEQMIFLLYKLINSITVGTLTQVSSFYETFVSHVTERNLNGLAVYFKSLNGVEKNIRWHRKDQEIHKSQW